MRAHLARIEIELSQVKHHKKSWLLLLDCVERALIAQRLAVKELADSAYRLNKADILPPVGCPLLLSIGGFLIKAERISHIEERNQRMDYRTETDEVISGRFDWTYP